MAYIAYSLQRNEASEPMPLSHAERLVPLLLLVILAVHALLDRIQGASFPSCLDSWPDSMASRQ